MTTVTTDFEAYSVGIVCMSVCVAESMSRGDVEFRANIEHPAGSDLRWEISSDPTFRGGETNPCQCKDEPDRLHYLLNC